MEQHLKQTFPRGPRLQYDDEHDMKFFLASEERWLNGTGKASDGSVHIPIHRAMEQLAQRGLPQVSGPFLPANASAPSGANPTGVAAPQPARGNGGARP
jgi:hypothetical protein